MREADQASGSREGLGARIRVLLIELHISFPKGPGSDAQRAFGEEGSEQQVR